MSSRWTGFFVWALVAACSAFWGIKIFAATRPVPDGAMTPPASIAAAGPMDRLFGAIVVPATQANAPPPESSRYQLMGVIAAPAGYGGRGGMAIVSVDNQPARAWHVGATLDGNTSLLSVARRTADFGPSGGPVAFTLQLPEPTSAATGTLPGALPGPSTGMPGGQVSPGGSQTTLPAGVPAYASPNIGAVPGPLSGIVGQGHAPDRGTRPPPFLSSGRSAEALQTPTPVFTPPAPPDTSAPADGS
jgi:general secretion pathway protein C